MLFNTYINNNLKEDTIHLNKKLKKDLEIALNDYDQDIKNKSEDTLDHLVFYLKDIIREYSPQIEEVFAIYKLKNNCSSAAYHVSSDELDEAFKKLPTKLIN